MTCDSKIEIKHNVVVYCVEPAGHAGPCKPWHVYASYYNPQPPTVKEPEDKRSWLQQYNDHMQEELIKHSGVKK